MAEALEPFTVQLSKQDIADLQALVNKRGLSANTVLRQAIGTERLIADNVDVGKGDKLIIEKSDDSLKQIIFKTPEEQGL